MLGHLGLAVNRLIRISFGPFQLGDLVPGAIEEVRTRTLRDQLGTRIAALIGADFSGPVEKNRTIGAIYLPLRGRSASKASRVGVERYDLSDQRLPRPTAVRFAPAVDPRIKSGAGSPPRGGGTPSLMPGRGERTKIAAALKREARRRLWSGRRAGTGATREAPRAPGSAQKAALMRIVGGQLRGRALVAPRSYAIRPSADRLRESLFNILVHAYGDPVTGARVLDLFAGTGALGLEALSRGAGFALFIDDAAEARALLRENVAESVSEA